MFGDLTRWAVHKIIGMKNEDTQSYILKCPVINAGKNPTESEYSDIFLMDVTIQINVSKESMQNFKIREEFKKGI